MVLVGLVIEVLGVLDVKLPLPGGVDAYVDCRMGVHRKGDGIAKIVIIGDQVTERISVLEILRNGRALADTDVVRRGIIRIIGRRRGREGLSFGAVRGRRDHDLVMARSSKTRGCSAVIPL